MHGIESFVVGRALGFRGIVRFDGGWRGVFVRGWMFAQGVFWGAIGEGAVRRFTEGWSATVTGDTSRDLLACQALLLSGTSFESSGIVLDKLNVGLPCDYSNAI